MSKGNKSREKKKDRAAKGKGKSKGAKGKAAREADRHDLYQQTVQHPEYEVELASRYFRKRVGRRAMSLREDFCGTALLCATWAQSYCGRVATGVDFDPEVLAWGRKHNIDPLGDDSQRVTLHEQDVRLEGRERHDILMALNYSYFCFKDRETLRGYFESARTHLKDDGLFFLDLFGGWEAQQVFEEERLYEGYKYIWHQAKYNPITADFLAHIHFHFDDGSRLRKAFTYDWRLWTMPELRELLAEAGFSHVEVLWEGVTEDGEGDGEFKPKRKVDNDPGFNAYLMASVTTPPRIREKMKSSKK